jgi:hypothetical protein
MKNHKMTLMFAALGMALASVAADSAHAANVLETCNGSPVIWRGGTTLHRNRCSIADSGDVNTAYWNGSGAWNRVKNVITDFFMNDPADCLIGHGDGENEVGRVNRANIDGNNGLTVLRFGLCFIGSNDIDEGDIMIANDLSFTPVNGNFLGTTGRSTFVHEFGHFYGFAHDAAHAVMRPSPPHIVTGGLEPSTNWPRDTSGMNTAYGFGIVRPNLLPSALGVVGAGVQTLDPAIISAACRGTTRSTRFYLGNEGNVGSGIYNLRIRLSTTAPKAGYSTSTTVVQTFTHSLAAFAQGTFDLSFVIPAALPNGTYFIYMDMDHTGSITEFAEGDNSTVSAMRLQVNC